MDLYRKDIFSGGWFSFHSPKDNWVYNISQKIYNQYFNTELLDKEFGESEITEDLFLKSDLNFDFVKGKSVLVVGGGPSSSKLNKDLIDSYDLIFSCNSFYKNETLKKHKVDLALISDEVNLKDKDFINYITEHNTIIGFEHGNRHDSDEIIKLKEDFYPFVYLTRYFSRLGFAIRACVLARLLGAEKIHFIGVDGFKNKNTPHLFESNKKPPYFNDTEKFQESMIVFYEYMLRDLKTKELKNLSEDEDDSIYSGILEKVKNSL